LRRTITLNEEDLFNQLIPGIFIVETVLGCADNNGITNYGNICEQDVLDIWNSPKFKKDRGDIITGNAPEFCIENCLSWSLHYPETE